MVSKLHLMTLTMEQVLQQPDIRRNGLVEEVVAREPENQNNTSEGYETRGGGMGVMGDLRGRGIVVGKKLKNPTVFFVI